ncbi:MAG: hypothetical protein SGI71_04125, partial [Verrucomicrobiota bacterium]|nr:hypothetical protein [Verrucomicrobiota bacterium]
DLDAEGWLADGDEAEAVGEVDLLDFPFGEAVGYNPCELFLCQGLEAFIGDPRDRAIALLTTDDTEELYTSAAPGWPGLGLGNGIR